MVQVTRRSRKQRIEAAIAHALARRWEEAAEENRALLEEMPDDLEAANRLGKALTELGDVKGAIEAYRRSLEIDPGSTIARKNLARLEAEAPAKGKKGAKAKKPADSGGRAIRTESLIEASGKSAVFTVQRVNKRALQRLSAGDALDLQPGEHGIDLKTETRALLGHLEPRGGQRLRRLIEGGNRYEASVRSVAEDGTVTVAVRETFRHPSLLDEPSFLAPTGERRRKAPRAYTRASLVRDDDDLVNVDDEEEDEPDVWRDEDSEDDEADDADDADDAEDSDDEEDDAATATTETDEDEDDEELADLDDDELEIDEDADFSEDDDEDGDDDAEVEPDDEADEDEP